MSGVKEFLNIWSSKIKILIYTTKEIEELNRYYRNRYISIFLFDFYLSIFFVL